jgi:uncharacterized protein YjbI with pentapeptide repeats
MRWLKRNIWKAGITITCMLLLLALMVWLPVSAVGADERISGLATLVTGTVQATPTEDATVTALNKEKLAQEIQQLKNQNAPDPFGWLQTNASIFLSTLTVVIGGLFGLWRWREDRKEAHDEELDARNKELRVQAEERFQAAVTALGDEKEGTRVGGAILLRSFLTKEDAEIYGRYYTQIFDLATAHLRPSSAPQPSEDSTTPLPPTPLRQALIGVFKEAFPLARNIVIGDKKEEYALQSLDATYIQLDNAYLAGADLKQIWMPRASMRKANLSGTYLSGAELRDADLSGADLSNAHLSNAYLREAHLEKANLLNADLSGAELRDADLSGADLSLAHLRGAHLRGADLTGANLGLADLSDTHLTSARSLEGTKLLGITGLTKEQLEACKAKGAIFDEDTTPNSSQSPVSPSPTSQSNDAQAPDIGDSNATSPKPSSES